MKYGFEQPRGTANLASMPDLIKEYALLHREKKTKGISIRKKPESYSVEKDVEGAFNALVEVIKINPKSYDYSDFIHLLLDNSQTHVQDIKNLQSLEMVINAKKLVWIRQRFLIARSIRLIKNLKYIVESFVWNKADMRDAENTFSASVPNHDHQSNFYDSETGSEDSEDSIAEKKYDVKTNYLYDDIDVQTCLNARLIENGLRFRKNSEYILESTDPTYPIFDANFCVALAPVVSNHSDRPITYYFDKNVGLGHPLAILLNDILEDSDFLLQLKNTSFDMLSSYLSEKLKIDDQDMIETVKKEIVACNFDMDNIRNAAEELNEKDRAEHNRTEIFDDIMPLFNSNKSLSVRILFPINQNNVHWVSTEINMRRSGKIIQITVCNHNPYGEGILDENNFNLLRDTITRKIKSHLTDKDIDIKVLNVKSPYLFPRQAKSDAVSCGVIIVEDIINRIKNKELDGSTYSVGAKSLRNDQLNCVIKFLKNEQPTSVSEFITRTEAKKNLRNRLPSTKFKGNLKECILRKHNAPTLKDAISEVFSCDYTALLQLLLAYSKDQSIREMMKSEIFDRLALRENSTVNLTNGATLDKKVADFFEKVAEFKGSKNTENKNALYKDVQRLCSSESVFEFYIQELLRNGDKSAATIGHSGIKACANILEVNLFSFFVEGGKLKYSSENSNEDKLSGREIFIVLGCNYNFTVQTRQFGVESVEEVNAYIQRSYNQFIDDEQTKTSLRETYEPRYKKYNHQGKTFDTIIQDAAAFFKLKFPEMWRSINDPDLEKDPEQLFILKNNNDGPRLLKTLQSKYDELNDAESYCLDQEIELDKEHTQKEEAIQTNRTNYYNRIMNRIMLSDSNTRFKGLPKTVLRRIIDEHQGLPLDYFVDDLADVVEKKLRSWIGVLRPDLEYAPTKTNLIGLASQYGYRSVRKKLLELDIACPSYKDMHNVSAIDYHLILKQDRTEVIDVNTSEYRLQSGDLLNLKKFFAFHALRVIESMVLTYRETWYQNEYVMIRKEKMASRGAARIMQRPSHPAPTFMMREAEVQQYLQLINKARSTNLAGFYDNIKLILARTKKGLKSKLHDPIETFIKTIAKDPKYSYVINPSPLIQAELEIQRQINLQLAVRPHEQEIVLLDGNKIIEEKNAKINEMIEKNEALRLRLEEQKMKTNDNTKKLDLSLEENDRLKERVNTLSEQNHTLKAQLSTNQERLDELQKNSESQTDTINLILRKMKELEAHNLAKGEPDEKKEVSKTKSPQFFN